MKAPFSKQQGSFVVSMLLLALFAAGCGRSNPAAAGWNMPPPPVDVIIIKPRALPMTMELPGRIDPVRIAQVSARVDGIVLRRDFEQGASVTNGQILYQIDPAPYQATLDSAKANLTQASLLVRRYKPLVGINAVSRQNYDNAISAAAQAKASAEIAAINLGYCTVTAPISGRIGAALVTEGALVSQNAATPMALIQQMDPIYFDFTEPAAEVLKLEKDIKAGQLESLPSGEPRVTLELPDNTTYPPDGKLLFQDISADPSSGMVTLRAEFPNPDGWLLPGMFAVGKIEQAIAPNAVLVPQPCVIIGPDGSASVMLVANTATSTNVVVAQPIKIGVAVGTDWIVESGLKTGDRVILNGLQKAQPGMPVSPDLVQAPDENSNTPSAGQ